MTAPFPCAICGRGYQLVEGDNPLGTASLNEHFEQVPGHDAVTFEIASELNDDGGADGGSLSS